MTPSDDRAADRDREPGCGVGCDLAFQTDTLAVVYSMRCPNRCDFCCHAVEDYGEAALGVAPTIALLEQARAVGEFSLVAFTGGEPFLFRRDLQRILEAVDLGDVGCRVVTSAYFATSPKRARQVLAPLVAAGVTQLSVSTDPSHQQFVPRERAEIALQAGLDLGLRVEVATVFLDRSLKLEDVVTLPPDAHRVVRLAAPIGRGRHLDIGPKRYGLDDTRFRPCGYRSRFDVTVFPDGEVYPCCSGGYNQAAGLCYGNVHQDSFTDIVMRVRQDPLLRMVRRLGWRPLYALAEQKFPELLAELPDRSPLLTTCDLCVLLFQRTHRDPRFAPLLDYARRLVDTLDALYLEASDQLTVGLP